MGPGMKVSGVFNLIGEYVDGLRDGIGMLELKGGDIIQGKFANGLLEGDNIQYQYRDGKTFFGSYLANRKHGEGVFMYLDGTRFEGKYELDLRHGEGEIVFNDNRSLKGTWKIGKKEGEFDYFDGSKVVKVEFKNDMLVTEGTVIEGINK